MLVLTVGLSAYYYRVYFVLDSGIGQLFLSQPVHEICCVNIWYGWSAAYVIYHHINR